jgi:hypothetical protein
MAPMANNPEQPRRLFRSSRLLLAALLAGVTLTTIWLYITNFDLDQYREQIASEVSKQLQLPVRLGQAKLELREAGIACRFTDVAIGSPQADRELTAQTIWLQLAWRGVLQRQPIFSEIAFDKPHLRLAIDTTKPVEPATQPPTTESDWLDEFGIRRIEVRGGSLDLSWRTEADPKTQQLKLHAMNLEIDDLAKGSNVLVTLSTQLRDDPALPEKITLKGSLRLSAERPLTIGAWELLLTAKQVAVAPLVALLPARYQVEASGAAELALTLRGQAADSATIDARLGGEKLRIRPGPAYRQAHPLRLLQLSGEWQRTTEGHSLRKLAVQLDDARLTGEITHHEDERRHELQIALCKGFLPLATVLPWIPEQVQSKMAGLNRLQRQGELTVDAAEFLVNVPKTPGALPVFSVPKMKGLASRLVWTIPDVAPLEIVRMPIALEGGQWQVDRTEMHLGKIPVHLSGAFTQQGSSPPQISLQMQSRGDVAHLAELAAQKLPKDLRLAGTFGLSGRLEGPVDGMAFDLKLDLSQLQGSYGAAVTLPADPDAVWTAQGTLAPNKLLVSQSALTIAPLQATFHGELDWSGEPAVNLEGALALDDFTNLYPQIPALANLGLHGGSALSLEVRGPLAEPTCRGTLTLNGLGLPMHGVIGDLSAVRGQLQIDGRRLQGERVTALLGRSPVELRVNIPDLTSPRLDLKVQAAAVRADELIFRSDSRMLRDLNGRLLIDQDGITFAPVHVRLDQGTRATIHGSVKNFTAPKVDLTISGEYANVEEIIALWSDESETAHAARLARHAGSPPAPLPPINITVDAKNGDLYGMKFSDARTLIIPSDQHLLLHPFDFKVGDGYCTTQVLLDYAGANRLLRVSGHVENVDAYQVYNELLDRKSIIRGTLRGDFLLQGELGGTGSQRFLSTSYGNIHFTVHDGVMRHSPLIGSIFSVLNVSQLFQGQLPNVSLEGVPFTLMTADMTLDRGILQSNQLVIESKALDMSYLGKFNLLDNQLDLLVVVKPLGNVDTVVSHLPVAGWILTGEERAFLTAQFKVTGKADDPRIEAIPITTLSKGVLGIIQRTLSLPYKLVTDPAILWGKGGKKQ